MIYKKHKQHSIETKNQIVLLYLDKHMRFSDIIRQYNISSHSVLRRWIKQYKEFGTCVDRRGKASKRNGVRKGRAKKYKVKLEDLSKEQLIEKIKMFEDIKKSMAYLINQQLN